MREPGGTNVAAGRGWEAKANQGDVTAPRDTPAGSLPINPGRVPPAPPVLCGPHPCVGIRTTWYREDTQLGQLTGHTAERGHPKTNQSFLLLRPLPPHLFGSPMTSARRSRRQREVCPKLRTA